MDTQVRHRPSFILVNTGLGVPRLASAAGGATGYCGAAADGTTGTELLGCSGLGAAEEGMVRLKPPAPAVAAVALGVATVARELVACASEALKLAGSGRGLLEPEDIGELEPPPPGLRGSMGVAAEWAVGRLPIDKAAMGAAAGGVATVPRVPILRVGGFCPVCEAVDERFTD